MAKSSAERQAAYRSRHFENEDRHVERLNLVIDIDTKKRLARLSKCYGVTKRAMLERLVMQAEQDALYEADTISSTGCAEYFSGELRLKDTVIPGLQSSDIVKHGPMIESEHKTGLNQTEAKNLRLDRSVVDLHKDGDQHE
ncbi:MAG: hypothetical protein WCL27_16050 [Betaproteobacteria bacterium]